MCIRDSYYILHVDLENFNLSHVPVYIMGEEQLSMYAMYMSSLGNRPDLFPQSGYASKYYENPPADYDVPAALLGSDETFARLMEEADKYVGLPYVWGLSRIHISFPKVSNWRLPKPERRNYPAMRNAARR